MTVVHVVTIREAGVVVVLARGHVMYQSGNERLVQPQSVQGVHISDAIDPLDARYGHVVHA